MADEFSEEDEENEEPKRYDTHSELFEDECVNALMFGMSYEQYWCEDPEIFLTFAKFYVKRTKEDFIDKDLTCWMIGSYVNMAITNNLNGAFGGQKVSTYPKSPVFNIELDEKAKKKKQEAAVTASYGNFLARLNRMGKEIKEAAS